MIKKEEKGKPQYRTFGKFEKFDTWQHLRQHWTKQKINRWNLLGSFFEVFSSMYFITLGGRIFFSMYKIQFGNMKKTSNGMNQCTPVIKHIDLMHWNRENTCGHTLSFIMYETPVVKKFTKLFRWKNYHWLNHTDWLDDSYH